jgi:hypothetical protein
MHQRLSECLLEAIGSWVEAKDGGSRTKCQVECWTHSQLLLTAYLPCSPPVSRTAGSSAARQSLPSKASCPRR